MCFASTEVTRMPTAIKITASVLQQQRGFAFVLLFIAGIFALLKSPICVASDGHLPKFTFSGAANNQTPEFPSHFWNKNRRSTDLHLLPPKLMNTDQLLASARSIRDKATCQSQRILNNVWLTMEQSKRYEGAKALGKVLSLGYFSYRRALTPAEINNPLFSVLDMFSEDTLITHFKNYDVEFSSKTILFSIRKEI